MTSHCVTEVKVKVKVGVDVDVDVDVDGVGTGCAVVVERGRNRTARHRSQCIAVSTLRFVCHAHTDAERTHHPVQHLVLAALARLDVDEREVNVRDEEDDRAADVEDGVHVDELRVPVHHDPDLLAQRDDRAGGAPRRRFGHEGDPVRALFRPRVQDQVDLRLRDEVIVDQVEEELGRVGVRRDGVADARKVVEGGRRLAAVGGAPSREDHGLVESVKYFGRRLVDRGHDDEVLLGQLGDEAHDGGGGRGVEAGRGLVEEEELRLLDQREGDREAALLAAREALHELVAHQGVGAARQAHRR